MATYAIGDVQGCYAALQRLLNLIQYDDSHDRLWFTGDLVNRGENSLAVLRLLKTLKKKPVIVLGNHDLHLLNVYYHRQQLKTKDTLHEILTAPDVDELCAWLRFQPLLHVDEALKFILVHAGILPAWNMTMAQQCAREVEQMLQSEQVKEFFQHLYGNEPCCWHDQLQGFDRLRLIVNSFTRMRFCNQQGCLNLANKTATPSPGDIPWFKIKNRASKNERIIFGHWAALMGKTATANVYALDTGCVWGNQLTAMRLEDLKYFQVSN